MTKRSLALAVASFASLETAATACEAANLDRAWTTELRSRDAVVRAQHVATHTKHLLTGTGIAYAFTRHPMAMVAAAVEGAAATGGRLTIGVGAGTAHTRGEFGLTFDHPAPRLSEYVAVMRAAVDSEGTLEFHGRFYDVHMPGFAFGQPRSVLDGVRFYGAALMPTALKAMAKSCDGIALHPFGHLENYLDDVVFPAVSTGPRDPVVAAWMIACALPDAEQARRLAKAQIALYAAQPGFTGFFEHTAWSAQAAAVREQVQLSSGRQPWAEIGERLIPGEMLDDLAAAGHPAFVAARVRAKEEQLARQGVDELTLQIPGVALPAERTGEVLSTLTTTLARPQS
jgi:alkanesulfonate monooxygenase SsuD/methylene tetrahydromethanopterin reductase-like flavin-dependent oxidoreductase (luciferase family)